ncbi:MAG: PQQ-binding-like beta-propeller repeat protein [Thaumarchaeota archaeon]|nr:PQQ-binding-like beta-propeller repeat protein [Nitrososphaerota archaeon]
MGLNDSEARNAPVATRTIYLSLLTVAILLGSTLVPSLIFTASAQASEGANWEFINSVQLGGSYNPQTQITKDNVRHLETKWIFPYARSPVTSLIGQGFGSGAPVIVADGIAYVAMNDRRILAIDAATGKLLWNNTHGTQFDSAKLIATYPWLSRPGAHVHAINYYRDKGWLITSSMGSCNLYAVDAKTGKTAWTLTTEQICGTNQEFGNPREGIIGSLGNQGFISGAGTHPPKFLGNVMFFPVPGGSGSGGRSMVTAFDMTDPQNPKRLYRVFTQPPAQGDPDWAIKQCREANGNGWYFEFPRYLEGINHPARDREPTYLATQCTEVPDDVVKNDGMDLVPGSKTFGKMHTATNHGSAVWGNYPLDPELGIVYLGWGDQGPYPNLTHRYGPGLHGSGFTAFDVRTGKLVWWFNAIPHDLWDYDCSWSGIIGQVEGKKAYIKSCKSGQVFALDATNGKPFWVFDPPTTVRNTEVNYGVDQNNDPRGKDACCRMTKEDMGKPWMHYPKTTPAFTICYTFCIESDIAYDGKNVYVASLNEPRTLTITPVRDFGNQGQVVRHYSDPNYADRTNSNIWAVDVNTGKSKWTYRIDGFGYRGGLSVTGGMVMVYPGDGNLRFIDAESGKLLTERLFGIPVNTMPTVGADKNGKMKIFLHVGGGGGLVLGPAPALPADGTLIALGLPDKIPQPEEVVREVIKEVPKEVLREVLKEVPKEVIQEVATPVEVISPISYAVVGIGVVLIVVAGLLFSRRKKV